MTEAFQVKFKYREPFLTNIPKFKTTIPRPIHNNNFDELLLGLQRRKEQVQFMKGVDDYILTASGMVFLMRNELTASHRK